MVSHSHQIPAYLNIEKSEYFIVLKILSVLTGFQRSSHGGLNVPHLAETAWLNYAALKHSIKNLAQHENMGHKNRPLPV